MTNSDSPVTIADITQHAALAVSACIGMEYRWGLVTSDSDTHSTKGAGERSVMERAWAVLPDESRRIVQKYLAESAWNYKSTAKMLNQRSLTKRQVEARRIGILKVAMKCIGDERWMRR